MLLTGDNENAAGHIAGQLGIQTVRAGCLPEDKLRYIDDCQQAGEPVCMIGDGINDAPALKKAHVGIAMGGVGSDIAVDAADIALVSDDIQELPHLLWLAKRMMGTIRCNMSFSMALNFVAILLAIGGILNPVVGPWSTTPVGAGDHQLRLSAALEEKSLTPAPGGAERESRWLSGFFS